MTTIDYVIGAIVLTLVGMIGYALVQAIDYFDEDE